MDAHPTRTLKKQLPLLSSCSLPGLCPPASVRSLGADLGRAPSRLSALGDKSLFGLPEALWGKESPGLQLPQHLQAKRQLPAMAPQIPVPLSVGPSLTSALTDVGGTQPEDWTSRGLIHRERSGPGRRACRRDAGLTPTLLHPAHCTTGQRGLGPAPHTQ